MEPHLQGFPPTSPPFFHCSRSVTGARPHFCVGANGWLAKICQPWEQSPSSSLHLSQAPNLHFAMQLLIHMEQHQNQNNQFEIAVES